MKISELLEEAMKSYENFKYDDAILYLETILEMDENNYDALALLTRIYSIAGIYTAALRYCEKAYKYYPENTLILFNMGYINQSLGRHKKAISYYKKYLEYEENYHVILNIGLSYMDMKYYRKAMEFIERAIKLEPDNSDAYLDKAECLAKQGKYEEALKIYGERLENPENDIEEYYFYAKMANIKDKMGDINGAVKNYNIAISFENTDELVFEAFYELLLRENRKDEIELLFINYANSKVSKERVLNLEGRYASYIGDFERAEKICERLLILNPDDPLHYFNSAYVSEMLKDFDKALEFIKKAEKKTDNRELIKNARKRIMKSKRKYAKTVKESEK